MSTAGKKNWNKSLELIFPVHYSSSVSHRKQEAPIEKFAKHLKKAGWDVRINERAIAAFNTMSDPPEEICVYIVRTLQGDYLCTASAVSQDLKEDMIRGACAWEEDIIESFNMALRNLGAPNDEDDEQ